MDRAAIRQYIDRFETELAKHGPARAALCDGRGGRQDIRFPVIAGPALANPDASVLDVGCGFADLYGFLRGAGWRGRYTGIDIVPGLLKVARERYPDIELHEHDGSEHLDRFPAHDFVIASGVMNLALPNGGNEAHIERVLAAMFDRAHEAACADFMTSYVDFKHPGAWHTDPAWALTAANRLTRRVTLRADYMPYEFCLFLYKNVAVSARNVFQAMEQ